MESTTAKDAHTVLIKTNTPNPMQTPLNKNKEPPMPNPKPRACKSLNNLTVGDTFKQPYVITDADVQKFAEISGDFS